MTIRYVTGTYSDMAGIRQHYIPKLLLRGFAEKRKDEYYCYLHSKEKITRLNITNLAVQKKFYSTDDLSVDQYITDEEDTLAVTVKKLRTMGVDEVEKIDIARFVVILFLRTATARNLLSYMAAHPICKIKEYMSCHNTARQFFEAYISSDKGGDVLFGEVSKNFHALKKIRKEEKRTAKQIIVKWMIENIEEIMLQMPFVVESLSRFFSENLPSLGENAHIKSLSKAAYPPFQISNLLNMTWSLVNTDNELILGDSVAVGIDKDGRFFNPILSPLYSLNAIFMPIISHKILLGYMEKIRIDETIANRASVAISDNFYVSKSASPPSENLRDTIGIEKYHNVYSKIENDVKESFALYGIDLN